MCHPGRPAPDGRVPRRLAGLGSLPEREVADVVLRVLVGLDPLADAQLLRVEPGEPSVRRPRGDPEEDRAVGCPVGVATVEEPLDQVDDLRDVLRGAGQDVRRRHAQRRRVGEELLGPALGERLDRLADRGRALDDLVVDVGDVHHPADVVAAIAQVSDAAGRRTGTSGNCRRAPGRRRSGRSCRSRRWAGRAARAAACPTSACREAAASHAGLQHGHRARGDRPTGTLGADQVAARRLDADRRRVELEQPAIARAHRVERSPEPGASADDRHVDGRRPETGVGDARRGPRPAGCRSRSPRASPRTPGTDGRDRRVPAPPSSASATAWSATSPSLWPMSRGAPSNAMPPSRSGPPGPNGWLSSPNPSRTAGLPASAVRTRARSSGTVTLRFRGSPGTTWTGMVQASSRAASSVQVGGPSGGNRSNAASKQVEPGRLRGLRRDQVGPVHGGLDAVAAHPFERVRHRHDGDRSAVPCRGSGHEFDEIGRHERPRRVMDEDHAARFDPERPQGPDAVGHRLLSPSTAFDDRATAGGSQAASRISGTRSGATTTTIRSTVGADARASSVHASRGRPPIAARSLSAPAIRSDDPAAGTTTSTRRSPAADPSLTRGAAGRRSSGRPRSGGRG